MPDRRSLFVTAETAQQYRSWMQASAEAVAEHYAPLRSVFSGISVQELEALFNEWTICPEQGESFDTVMAQVSQDILPHSLAMTDTACVAHLHCPPLMPALAAETVINATNASMDSWDQSPAATLVEQRVCDWLCEAYALGPDADAVFTSGGTQSNLMGLLLAREKALAEYGVEALPRLRVFCSELAHFSVEQSAFLLGMGAQAVISVKADDQQKMDHVSLLNAIDGCREQGLLPIAVFATAGTTDFGSVDPLPEIAASCEQQRLWFHVDAAYGGALILSEQHRGLLAGIEQADSITVDFHKLFYQTISCGAFVVRNKAEFAWINRNADYLNPEEDEADGIPNLVGKSLQTTRRFDALKLLMSLKIAGRKGMEDMLDHTLQLASDVADYIESSSDFELAARPQMNAVVFRLSNVDGETQRQIKRQLLLSGKANLATTRYQGQVFLKVTLLNPLCEKSDVVALLNAIRNEYQNLIKQCA